MSSVQTSDYISRSMVTIGGCVPKNHPNITFEVLCNRHLSDVATYTDEKQKIPLRQVNHSVLRSFYLLYSSIFTVTKQYFEYI